MENSLLTSWKLSCGGIMQDLILIGFVMSFFWWTWKQVFWACEQTLNRQRHLFLFKCMWQISNKFQVVQWNLCSSLITGQCKPFPVQRWIRPKFHYRIRAYDTILPQDDPNKLQRTHELDYKRTLYKYSGKETGLPGLTEKIPIDEEFSVEYFLVGDIRMHCCHFFSV